MSTVEHTLIYQTPDNIYDKGRKSDLAHIIFDIVALCGTSVVILIFFFSQNTTSLVCILSSVLSLLLVFLVSSLFNDLKKARLKKFKIYTDGFETPTRPLNFIFEKKVYFISFKSINDVYYIDWGLNFFLKFNERDGVLISTSWGDIECYARLFNIIKNQFSHINPPDISIVIKYFNAHEKLSKKEINRDEFLSIYSQMIKINENFGIKNY